MSTTTTVLYQVMYSCPAWHGSPAEERGRITHYIPVERGPSEIEDVLKIAEQKNAIMFAGPCHLLICAPAQIRSAEEAEFE